MMADGGKTGFINLGIYDVEICILRHGVSV